MAKSEMRVNQRLAGYFGIPQLLEPRLDYPHQLEYPLLAASSYQERTAQEGFFGSSTPSENLTVSQT